ncbi:MAG TPA: zinc ribbon domain-containing protein [Gaiellaceae bacterium]|nr:zinc ribbon domain-containing protein [Gaiellaceae bacterium]
MQSRTELRCPRCGTPVEPLQEVCLQCGIRLPGAGRLGGILVRAWRSVIPWYPGDWIWPVLALAFLAVGSTAVALGARNERRAATPVLVATSSHVTVSLGTTTTPPTTAPPTTAPTTAATTTTHSTPLTTQTVPQPTISTGTLPLAPGSPSNPVTTTAPPTTTTPSGVRSWPTGRSGWTDVLESIPESSGRAAADARARQAQRDGVPAVGVLLSSQYGSLHSGYWVVFSGVYASQSEAQGSGLSAARAHGFPGAYPARVSH